jgi:hypothetical protein
MFDGICPGGCKLFSGRCPAILRYCGSSIKQIRFLWIKCTIFATNFLTKNLTEKDKYTDEEFLQNEGIIKPEKDISGILYFDPLTVKTFSDLVTNMVKKVSIPVRKKGLENYLANNRHETFEYKTVSGIKANIWVIKGAKHDDTEFHTAEKLARAGNHVLFPSQIDLGQGRKNDIYLYDAKTFIQQKVELKALFGETAEVIKSQIVSGSGQASVIAYDIQSNIKKMWLIDGLRGGWNKNLKTVFLNYKGQWYQLNSKIVFSEEIYKVLK